MEPERVSTREEQAADERLRERYERAVRTALAWIEGNKASVTRLAEHLDENRSSLSKLINGEPSHVPTRQRPAMIRILEKIETHCATGDWLTVWARPSPATMVDEDPDYLFVHNHAERLDVLMSKYDTVQALEWAQELCLHAIYGPPQYRAAMAANTLLRLWALLKRPEAEDASPKLLRTTVDAIRRVEAAALESIAVARSAAARQHVAHRARGYAGAALATCGLYLGDPALIDDGLGGMFFAADSEHERRDLHWDNLFFALDRMIERGAPSIEAPLERLVTVLGASRDDKARHALGSRQLAHLRRHLEHRIPAFVRESEEPPGREEHGG